MVSTCNRLCIPSAERATREAGEGARPDPRGRGGPGENGGRARESRPAGEVAKAVSLIQLMARLCMYMTFESRSALDCVEEVV